MTREYSLGEPGTGESTGIFNLDIDRGSLHGILENIARNPGGVGELLDNFGLKQFKWEAKTILEGGLLHKQAKDGYRAEMIIDSNDVPEGLRQHKLLVPMLKLFEMLGKEGLFLGVNITNDDQMPTGLKFEFDSNGSKKVALALAAVYPLVGKAVQSLLDRGRLGETYPMPKNWSEALNMGLQYFLKKNRKVQDGVGVSINRINIKDSRSGGGLELDLDTSFEGGLSWEDLWKQRKVVEGDAMGKQEYFEWETPLAGILEENHLSDIHVGLSAEKVLGLLSLLENRTSIEEARLRTARWAVENRTFGVDTERLAIASQKRRKSELTEADDALVLADYYRDHPSYDVELETKIDVWIREYGIESEDRDLIRAKYLKEVVGVEDRSVIEEYLAGQAENDKILQKSARVIEVEWEKRRALISLVQSILENPLIGREIVPKLIRGVLQSGISKERIVSELITDGDNKIVVRLSQ